jgi:hypothetical protein
MEAVAQRNGECLANRPSGFGCCSNALSGSSRADRLKADADAKVQKFTPKARHKDAFYAYPAALFE